MTWNQFKQHIDLLLEQKGISQDEEIWYIDVSHPRAQVIGVEDSLNSPSVSKDDVLGIGIS